MANGTKVLILKTKLLAVATVSFILGFYGWRFATDGSTTQMWLRLLAGSIAGLSILLSLLSTWMTSMRISYGHTVTTAFLHIGITIAIEVMCFLKLKKIKENWKNPRAAQEEFLLEILKTNADTAYVKDYGLGEVTSLKELKEKHTLTDYERYRSYVDRMAKGEQRVMTRDPPFRFALTSGTTGKPKMLPYVNDYYSRMYRVFMTIAIDMRSSRFGSGGKLQREANLYTAPKVRYTESGTVMGPASLIAPQFKKFLALFSTPPEGFEIADPNDSVYVHLLFALRDPNLGGFNANFTSHLMCAMRQLEQCWPDFVRDIKEGTVSTKKVAPEIHRALVKAMGGGDRERAAELKREFEKGFHGIMRRIWPYLKWVGSIDSVGIKSVLAESYVKDVVLYGQAIGATEGMFGINLWPTSEGKDEFVLVPQLCVLEFIPEDKMSEDQPDTLFIDELHVGGVYEVVITQIFGIYRFRYGDVIRVTRYHLETPVVEFMYRSGQILNVHSEKLDQRTAQRAIEAAVSRWHGVTLRDYAVAESTLLDRLEKAAAVYHPYYVIFIELDQGAEKTYQNEDLLQMVDEELCRHSFTYNSFREKGSIAPPSVHIVKSGAFDRLHEFILENSTTAANQYKVPRKLRTEATLKIMLENSLLDADKC